jgi:hypothetical protein
MRGSLSHKFAPQWVVRLFLPQPGRQFTPDAGAFWLSLQPLFESTPPVDSSALLTKVQLTVPL